MCYRRLYIIYLQFIVNYVAAIYIVPDNNTVQPCTPNPCDPSASCDTYGNQFAICDPCFGSNGINNPACRPECVLSTDCAFDKACLRNKCVDPCPGSCGVNAECSVYLHDPICRCVNGFEGNPYEHCKPTTQRKLFLVFKLNVFKINVIVTKCIY